MSEVRFRLIYDGPAVDDGEMEVTQLAPSLLALGKLLEAVDAAVYGDAGRVRVKVRADVRRGSFDVGIALDFVHAVKAWLLSPDGSAVASLVTITGITGASGVIGLFQLVRWIGSRKVKSKVTIEAGKVRIETVDGDFIVVTEPVAQIVDDQNIRQQLERFTEPLRQEGVSAIGFSTAEGRGEALTAGEAAAFTARDGSDHTSQSRFEATYQIKRLYFERQKVTPLQRCADHTCGDHRRWLLERDRGRAHRVLGRRLPRVRSSNGSMVGAQRAADGISGRAGAPPHSCAQAGSAARHLIHRRREISAGRTAPVRRRGSSAPRCPAGRTAG